MSPKASRSSADGAQPPVASSSAGLSRAAVPYVPRYLIDALLSAPDRRPPWLDTVEGTLVMADVSGFTAMSERLASSGKEGAETLTTIINSFFTLMLDIACAYDGIVMGFGGDAILMLFTGPGHADRALATSLKMLEATARKGAYRVGGGRVKLGMSMGAHSGEFHLVAAGDPAVRMQFLVMGEGTCRTCAAEAIASSGEVCVTAETLEALGVPFGAEPRGEVWRVTGLAAPVTPSCGEPPALPAAALQRLLTFLPPPIARVLETGEGAADIEGEHRKVAVVFVNILGGEGLLAAEGPDALLEETQGYVARVVRLADRHGGFLVSNDTYDHGFKLILVFGAPVAHEWDTSSAFRFVCELKDEHEGAASRLEHRFGVNSGFVFAGDVGPSYRRQYTVMGDAVNLSARLMSSAKPGEAIVSSSSAEEAGAGFVVEELEPIRVKGKSDPIPIGRLASACDTPAEGEAAPIFGRAPELAALAEARRHVERGEGAVLLVEGEPGIGKSRLVREAVGEMRAEGWQVHAAYSYTYTSTSPFAPWMQALESIFGLSRDLSREQRSAAVSAAALRLAPALADLTPLLAPLLDVDLPSNPVVASLAGDDRRGRLFDVVAALVTGAAEEVPLALVFEDVHWADPDSLRLIEHLAARVAGRRVALLLSRRPPEQEVLALPERVTTTIPLGELPSEASGEMVRSVVGSPDLPPKVVEAILEKGRGNPLFIEEISAALDAAALDAGGEAASALAALDIPDRIQGLIMSRVDRLPPGLRDTLRTAAVVGQRFETATMEGLMSASPRDVRGDLGELARLGLLEGWPARQASIYRFRHALIQEVAYESLLFAKRRRVHTEVAEYLERTHGDHLEPVLEALVYHFSAGADEGRTRRYAILAAEKATRLFAHEQAVHYYRSALATLKARTSTAGRERSVLQERVGDCQESAGLSLCAVDSYRDALTRWRRSAEGDGDGHRRLGRAQAGRETREREARLCHKIGLAEAHAFRHRAALRWLDSAQQALPRGVPELGCGIALAKSLAHYRHGGYRESIRWARRGLDSARRAGDPRSEAYALTNLANGYYELGRVTESIRYDDASVRLYEAVGDLPGQALVHGNLGAGYLALGMIGEALSHLRTAVDTHLRVGNLKEAAAVGTTLGEALLAAGRNEEAFACLEEALERCDAAGDVPLLRGLVGLYLSRAASRIGDEARARGLVETSIEALGRADPSTYLAEALLDRAEMALQAGAEDAETLANEALAVARAQRSRHVEVHALRLSGRMAASRGDLQAASEALSASVSLAERAGAPYMAARSLVVLAEVLAEGDAPQRRTARNALSRAMRAFEDLDAGWDLGQARALDGIIKTGHPTQGFGVGAAPGA